MNEVYVLNYYELSTNTTTDMLALLSKFEEILNSYDIDIERNYLCIINQDI